MKIHWKDFIVIASLMLTISPSAIAQSLLQRVLWSIGQTDGSNAEFTWSLNEFAEFAPKGFGEANRYYVVGKSEPEHDWTYILPGPKDDFAGYGYWAGMALHRLSIYFQLDEISSEGTCTFAIDSMEVNSENAPLFCTVVNGKYYDHQLQPGKLGKVPKELNTNP